MSIKRNKSNMFRNMNNRGTSVDISRAITRFFKLNKERVNNIVLNNVELCSNDFEKYISNSYKFLNLKIKDIAFTENVFCALVEEIQEDVDAIDLEAIRLSYLDGSGSEEYLLYLNNIICGYPLDKFNKIYDIVTEGHDVLKSNTMVDIASAYYSNFTADFIKEIPQTELFDYFGKNILQFTGGGKSTSNYFRTFQDRVLKSSYELGRDGLHLIEEEAIEVYKLVFHFVKSVLFIIFTSKIVDKAIEYYDKEDNITDNVKLVDFTDVLALIAEWGAPQEEVGDTSEKLEYIDDWKQLSSLARSYGYELVRCKGDHGIFQNDEDKLVIIPQGRTIGKGLSIKIQKQIING